MSSYIRLMPVILALAAAQAFAGDSDPVKPASTPATPAATADAAPPANSGSVPVKRQPLVLEDKTLTNDEVRSLLSQGYKPQKGRGDNVLYCRDEPQMGTHFEKKVCLSADQIKQRTADSRDITDKLQRNGGNPQKP